MKNLSTLLLYIASGLLLVIFSIESAEATFKNIKSDALQPFYGCYKVESIAFWGDHDRPLVKPVGSKATACISNSSEYLPNRTKTNFIRTAKMSIGIHDNQSSQSFGFIIPRSREITDSTKEYVSLSGSSRCSHPVNTDKCSISGKIKIHPYSENDNNEKTLVVEIEQKTKWIESVANQPGTQTTRGTLVLKPLEIK